MKWIHYLALATPLLASFAARADEGAAPVLNLVQRETVVLATLVSEGFGPGSPEYKAVKSQLDQAIAQPDHRGDLARYALPAED